MNATFEESSLELARRTVTSDPLYRMEPWRGASPTAEEAYVAIQQPEFVPLSFYHMGEIVEKTGDLQLLAAGVQLLAENYQRYLGIVERVREHMASEEVRARIDSGDIDWLQGGLDDEYWGYAIASLRDSYTKVVKKVVPANDRDQLRELARIGELFPDEQKRQLSSELTRIQSALAQLSMGMENGGV